MIFCDIIAKYMIMGNLDKRTIYIIFASAFLVNPVLLNNSTTTMTTSQSTSSQVSPSTEPTTTTTMATTTIGTTPSTMTTNTTTPQPTTITTTTPQPTTITTTELMTTAVPIEIGGNCSISESCEAYNPNTECNTNGYCQCKADKYFQSNGTCEPLNSLIPTSLSLNSTETTITVAWVGPTGLSSEYKVAYNVTVKGNNSDQTKTTTDEIITVSGLTAGQIYIVYIFTVLNDSISSERVNGSIVTIPNPPDCPSYRNDYNASHITITWIKPDGGVEGYTVQFDSGTSFNVTSEMAEIGNLDPGKNYTLTLKTYANDRTSVEKLCVIRTESEVPDPPNNVTKVNMEGQDNFNISITMTGEPRGDIVGYRIDIYGKNYTDQSFDYRRSVTIADTMDNIYQVTGLQAGSFYNIQVYTINDKFSSSISFNLNGLRTAEDVPERIFNFRGISSKDSFEVMFQRPNIPNGDITGYKILVTGSRLGICKEYHLQYVNISANKNCTDVFVSQIELNQKDMELNVTDLLPSVTFTVNILAYTAEGPGIPFTTTVMTNVAAPYKPGIVNATLRGQYVLVTWEQPLLETGPTSYDVAALDIIEPDKPVKSYCMTNKFDDTNCTGVGLEEFWKYKFQVTAKVLEWKNTSDYSNIITTVPGKPGKPVEFKAPLENKGCKARLSWFTPEQRKRNANITMYTIQTGSRTQIYRVKKFEPYNPKKTQFFETLSLEKTEKPITIKISWRSGSTDSDAEDLTVNTAECFDPLSGGEIAGIIICVLLLVTVFGLGGLIVYRRWECIKEYLPDIGRRQSTGEFEPLQPPPERYRLNNESMKRPIVLSAIGDFLRKYHADDNRLFIGEYEDLKQLSPRHTTNSANLDENKPKNRYTNILPYDHSRVVLAPMIDEEDSSDYINANYIPGYTYGKEFIASQGPLPGTANDFWRMIWEQSVSIVVMLTKCSENNMDKCEHYWPHAANEPKCYNDLMVNVTSVSNMGKYDIHIMDVSLGDDTRVVKHFHFLEWPDFSAKVETTTLIEFITTVRQHITPDIKGPTVTHCSAGVGRTGTFITVDYLMQYVEDHDLSSQVDIFDWVIQMRDHRTTMVQTWTQYAFIHDCLSEIVERKRKLQNPEVNGEVSIDNLAFEPDDLYENTKVGQLQTEL
ncbi:tyrosine-protein phosphatase 10D-like isoform X2 [Mytilus californianus]|uniref:tyrosine-protein phosphatase 10D-like isoform X2 n=1 Tax=Mytilus californianus TaxID=6549 RepID=UPI0022469749|nr:tyrosine-protein phosphatase 10D-like isoform X2 [Mytilus californianus]